MAAYFGTYETIFWGLLEKSENDMTKKFLHDMIERKLLKML
ncbi:uncharacterized protein G2W53_004409 [Senna tora]|nr:uncharacterized protein G2W53_004344 [Senna tora]KAF7842111.1 uncharacterized protein G2W53_004409 [Senna tora]